MPLPLFLKTAHCSPLTAHSEVLDQRREHGRLVGGETFELDADAPAFEVVAHLAAERLLLGQPELDEDGLAARGAALGTQEVASLAEADDAVVERAVVRPAPVDVDVHGHPLVLALFGEGHEVAPVPRCEAREVLASIASLP